MTLQPATAILAGTRGTPDNPTTRPRAQGPLRPGQRWSAGRKREVVLRLLRGESVQALSRELAVEIYQLQQWHELRQVA